MSKICENCGMENEDIAKFCKNCGKELINNKPTITTKTSNHENNSENIQKNSNNDSFNLVKNSEKGKLKPKENVENIIVKEKPQTPKKYVIYAKKSVILSILFSIILMGLGFLYLEDWNKFLKYLISGILLILLYFYLWSFFAIIFIIIYIYQIYDAYNSTLEYNLRLKN